ncbi:hypothetical protein CR513_12884, partial [Mucuna pruriens]
MTKRHYQLDAIVGDTSSFVSLCAKFEFMLNLESSSNILHELDPKIDRTLRRLRKVKSVDVSNNSSFNSISNFDNNASTTNESNFSEYSSSNINSNFNFGVSKSQEPEAMVNNDRMLKELATLDVAYQPWCIQYLQLEPAQSYELKSGEDPHKHLKEFHVVYSMMKPQGIPKDYIKMKAFPFSLDRAAKDWLYLHLGDIKCTFLKKFFLDSRTTTIRKEICGIRQHSRDIAQILGNI